MVLMEDVTGGVCFPGHDERKNDIWRPLLPWRNIRNSVEFDNVSDFLPGFDLPQALQMGSNWGQGVERV